MEVTGRSIVVYNIHHLRNPLSSKRSKFKEEPMRTKPFLVFGILLAGAIASAQTPLLPAPHRHVTTVSPAEVRANEPSIAVNPNNPNQVVAAFQPAGIAYSTDGGQTFGLADLPAIEGWRGARIPRIARLLLLSHAPLTEERPSSTTRGKRLHLKPRERPSWATTHGWWHTNARCTEFGQKPCQQQGQSSQLGNRLVRRRQCELVSLTF